RKKSYHSIVVPIVLATTASTNARRCVSGSGGIVCTKPSSVAKPAEGIRGLIAHQNIPSSNFAASDIRSGVQGGSQTTSTLVETIPGMAPTFACTSGGSEPATGQAGEVRVILICTAPDTSTSMSYISPIS